MSMPIAQYVVSLGIDGRIASQGSVSETLANDDEMRKEAMESELAEKKADEVEATEGKEEKKGNDGAGKLVMAEEIAEGHVSFKSGALRICVTCLFESLTNYYSQTLPFQSWRDILLGVLRWRYLALRHVQHHTNMVAWPLGPRI